MGGRVGLDYGKLEIVARAWGLRVNDDVLTMIADCERTVLLADAAQRAAAKTASENADA